MSSDQFEIRVAGKTWARTRSAAEIAAQAAHRYRSTGTAVYIRRGPCTFRIDRALDGWTVEHLAHGGRLNEVTDDCPAGWADRLAHALNHTHQTSTEPAA